MKEWIKITCLLCTFGFLREFRPSEPFITDFLSGEWRNVTSDQVNREVYPWGTYSYLSQLIIIFLITDMLRYKPIIILSAIAGIVVWSLLLWTTTLFGLQMVQLVYGTFMAAEVAYYTYIYAKVDRNKYQKLSGYVRSSFLTGRFVASVLAQILVSFEIMDFRELNYLSLGSQIISLFWAFMLPSVGTSTYFYSKSKVETESNNGISNYAIQLEENGRKISINSKKEPPEIQNESEINVKPTFSCNRAYKLLWQHFIFAYSKKTVIMWSIWWSLAMCGFLLIQSYVQLLWQQIDPNRDSIYNGGVEAALTLLAAGSALGAGFLNGDRYKKWDIWILTICSVFEGVITIISAVTTNVWIAYVMYILFGVLYQFMITMASAAIAKKLNEDSFALIFGINTLMALVFQTLMTVIFISKDVLSFDPRGQFFVFGLYFIVLSIVYGITGVILVFRNKKNVH